MKWHWITGPLAICVSLGMPAPGAAAAPNVPIPQLALWQTHMLQLGSLNCNQAQINGAIGASGVVTEGNVWYYDGTMVYDQIAAYTGDPAWYACAQYTDKAYTDWVLTVTAGANWPVGALGGWRVFPDGALAEYKRTGDANSRTAVMKLAYNSAWANSGGDPNCEVSRETAYMINAYLAAEQLGQPRNPLLATSVNYALGHIDQWFTAKSCHIVPFMVGLTLNSLIHYYEITGDARIPPAIQTAADGLWNQAWVPANSAFYYDSAGDTTTGIADLNLLVAPAYAWLWKMNMGQQYLTEGDQIFSGGVLYGNFWTGKQFSQNYWPSFNYVKWRSTATPISAVSVTPAASTGTTQTLTGVFYDPAGASDLYAVFLLANSILSDTKACVPAYIPGVNGLYLLNDAGNGFVPGTITPGSAGTLSNGQCTIASGGLAVMAGNTLTLPLQVTASAGFLGVKQIFGYTLARSGVSGGWQTLGSWTPGAAQAPAAVSVTPTTGAAANSRVFSARFTSPSGAADLQIVYLLANGNLSVAGGCFAAYIPATNQLLLLNDAGSAFVAGSLTAGGSGTISNTHCTLASGGAAVVSGNSLTVPFAFTAARGFSGTQGIYAFALGQSGLGSGWTTAGSWITP